MLESLFRAVGSFLGLADRRRAAAAPPAVTRVVWKSGRGPRDRLVTWWVGGAAVSTATAFIIFLTHAPRAAPKVADAPPPFMLSSDGLRVQSPSGPLWTERDLDRIWNRLTALEADKAGLQQRLATLETKAGDVTGSLGDKPARALDPTRPGGLAIDLGGFRSLSALKARLADIKRQVPDLAIPGARVLTADVGPDQVEVRLLVGPLKGAEDVLAACAKLKAAGVAPCLPAALTGLTIDAR